jgi:hypothetical protein
MPIGDVNSNERGSGARFNDGKPDLSLIPPLLLPCLGQPQHRALLAAVHDMQLFGRSGLLLTYSSSLLSLWMAEHYKECAAVFSYGAKKYAAHNWMKGMKWSVPIACALRHAHALWYQGEENDPESGLPHIGHILCNLVMLRHYLTYYQEGNDLPHTVLNANANT